MLALFACSLLALPVGIADSPVFQLNESYRVSTKSRLTGKLELPAVNDKAERKGLRSVTIDGTAKVAYRERILDVDASGRPTRTVRLYDVVEYERNIADQQQKATLRPTVRRIVVDRRGAEELAYSPDGPLQWTEWDLLKTHEYVPAIVGLLPPSNAPKTQTWTAEKLAASELSGLQKVESGKLTCSWNGTIEHEGAKLGQIVFDGTLVGVSTEGRTRNTVRGALYVELSTMAASSLHALGILELLGDNDRVVGRLESDYQLMVRRINDPSVPSAAALKLTETPASTATHLVYEHPAMGIRIQHPRSWTLSSVDANRLTLENGTNSVAMNIEKEKRVPTLADYRREVRQHLETLGSTGIKITAEGEPQEVTSTAGRIGRFRIEAINAGKPLILDHWVMERGSRGVTVASRLQPSEASNLSPEVERIVRSMEFFIPLRPADLTKSPEKQ